MTVKDRFKNWIQKMREKDPEKLREYWRKKKARYRKKKRLEKKRQQDKEIEEQIRKGNINYNPNVKNAPFMTYREYKEEFPEATFKEYMQKKIEHDRLQRLKRIPKARGRGFNWEGIDLWNENPKEVDPISEEEKQLIQDMFSNPKFPESENLTREKQKQLLEEHVDRIAPKKKKSEEEEEN